MSTEPMCARFEADGTLARYNAGALAPDESAAFEDHFLTCVRCQESLSVAVAAHAHFANGAPIRRRFPLTAVLVGVAAASLAAVIAVNGFGSAQVRALGIVAEPPLYVGEEMRGPDDGAAAFEEAMAAYSAGDYEDALRKFGRLPDHNSVIVQFFTGASHIMLEQPWDADAAFTRVIEAGPSPYRGEARYYRAKARLQLNRKADAVADLRAAIEQNAPVAQQARELLMQVEE